ncbi:Bcr/CflA family multidrug efflux MFS transporter [Pelagibaculum spongiae]|uniref:Bcr/CflA family efflux transporter n=1 Tax=Pelagibaculum spongiae TaxID=2080658 RepID=A0A2V1GS40_9GAMM|nr:Bcr/CflA family multidrug efflux MFS transporter [Pelagibaculum spongiae]PVZ68209.1 Bcr/CflA family drug resistance efflux transporter [Pelagibaculum spongiae]
MPQQIPRYQLIIVLSALAMLGPFTIDLILPAFPAMAADLAADPQLIQLTMTSYFAGFSISQLFFGPMSDRFGRLRIIFFGLMSYVIASIACYQAQSAESLIFFRCLQAVGGGAIMVTINAVVRDLCQRQEAARLLSISMLVVLIAPLIAPSVGGFMLTLGSWRWLFIALVVLAMISSLITLLWLPESLPKAKRKTPNFSQLMDGFGQILKHRAAMSYTFSGSLAFAGMFVFLSASPFVYIEHFGVTESEYGLLFALNIGGMLLLTLLNGRLLKYFDLSQLLQAGIVLMVGSGIAMSILAANHAGLTALTFPLVLFIASIGLISANSNAGGMAYFSSDKAGSAAAIMGLMRGLMGTLGSAVIGWMNTVEPLPMALVMLVCALGAAVSALYGRQQLIADRAAEVV